MSGTNDASKGSNPSPPPGAVQHDRYMTDHKNESDRIKKANQ